MVVRESAPLSSAGLRNEAQSFDMMLLSQRQRGISSGKQLSGVTLALRDTTTGESVVTKISIGLNYSFSTTMNRRPALMVQYRLSGCWGARSNSKCYAV